MILQRMCSLCNRLRSPKPWYSSNRCAVCYGKEWKLNNPEKVKAQQERHYYKDHEATKAEKKRFRENHKESVKKSSSKAYYKKAEYYKQRAKEYDLNNRHRPEVRLRKVLSCVRRRTRKMKATPEWVNKSALEDIYRNCPAGYHVDHIIPLKARIYYSWGTAEASGLHVPWNLQYLPAEENIRKGNRVNYRSQKMLSSPGGFLKTKGSAA